MHTNYHREGTPPKALEGLEVVEDFKYLGGRIALSLPDFRQRKGIAWSCKPFGDLIAYLYT